MPRFVYRAKASPGQVKEGVIEADTQRAAIYKINQMGYFPIQVIEELSQAKMSGDGKNPFFYSRKRLGWRDLSLFTRQLADLLGSGLTMLKALEVTGRQTENNSLRAALEDVRIFVKDGGTFSDGLSRHPGMFSRVYVSMVKAGEAGGMLDEVLERLSDYTQTQEQLRDKIQSALAYPALMAALGVITIIILLTLVIPQLVTVFQESGQALPLPTMILVNLSDFLLHYGWLAASAVVIAIFLFKRYAKTKEGRLVMDSFRMKMFGIGPLVKKAQIARFTKTLSALLTNGVPMVQSLEVAASTIENEVLKNGVTGVIKDVTEGAPLSKAILKLGSFPLAVTNMISVGEESGNLEKALFKVAESCQRDVDRALGLFTSLLEPFIILVMGCIVGFIVVSMLLPIFQINLMAR